MRQTHIVMGHTGEYGDSEHWLVAAFQSKRRADTFARRANEWCGRNGLAEGTSEARDAFYQRLGAAAWNNPYDPGMALDYTGTAYSVVSVTSDPPLPTKAQGA